MEIESEIKIIKESEKENYSDESENELITPKSMIK